MRLIRVGWPILPALVAMFLLALPDPEAPAVRALLLAITAVGLSVAVTSAYVGSRVEPLIRAAERVAAGEEDGGMPGRKGWPPVTQTSRPPAGTIPSGGACGLRSRRLQPVWWQRRVTRPRTC